MIRTHWFTSMARAVPHHYSWAMTALLAVALFLAGAAFPALADNASDHAEYVASMANVLEATRDLGQIV